MPATARSGAGPITGELVSLTERASALGAVRFGFVVVVLAFALGSPDELTAPRAELTVGSLAYLSLVFVPLLVRGRSTRGAIAIIGATLLLDGVFLGWAVSATGGTQSPLWFLVFANVVAVTLLGSYRTGLKISAWHALVFVGILYAQAAELMPMREGLPSALPEGADFIPITIARVGAIAAVALVATSCAAVRERELRAQKVDLEELSRMVGEIDRRSRAAEIPEILLDALGRAFGFPRQVVLASPRGDLEVLAHRGIDTPPAAVAGIDPVAERAWQQRRTQLVRELDPTTAPHLSALLPGARRLLVVPFQVEDGSRLGILALECRDRRHTIRRWTVTVVEQFAAHAALSLRNAWLREQLEQRYAENRALQQQLVAQNLGLEEQVEERTRDLRQSLERLRLTDEQRRMLLERLVHVEEDERKRIAGDIHDDPVQTLTAASMWLQLLRRDLTDPKHLEDVDKLLQIVADAIGSLRTLTFRLRPSVLDEDGLAPALREYLDSLDAAFEHRVEDRLELEPPSELGVVLYRMAQEALNNINKHANAKSVHVLLEHRRRGYLLRIDDDGVGFTAPASLRSERGHLGLTSMRERATMAGGTCRLESSPGAGTTVEFWVPHPGASEPADDPADGDARRTAVPA